MNIPILTLPLRSKRDLVLARQYARQIAGLLSFDPPEQMEIAAVVFEIAQTATRSSRSTIQFELKGNSLHVFPIVADCPVRRLSISSAGQHRDLRLMVPLPEGTEQLTREDLLWVVQQLTHLTPVNLFAELQQQNQQFLLVMKELQACRAELRELRRGFNKPAAA